MFSLPVHLCTICVPGTHGGQKRTLDSLEPELKRVVGHHGSAGNQFRSSARAAALLTAESTLRHHACALDVCFHEHHGELFMYLKDVCVCVCVCK